ncbi:MAG: hypothetical protein QW471_04040 [Candidatus Woesearchaeota archaeon]
MNIAKLLQKLSKNKSETVPEIKLTPTEKIKKYLILHPKVAKSIAIATAAAILAGGTITGFYLGRKTSTSQPTNNTNIEQNMSKKPTSTIEELIGFNEGYSTKINSQEEDSFSRYSPIFQSFLSPDYAKKITSEIKGLEHLAILYDGKLENGEVKEVLFVNDGRPYNLVYKISDKNGKISYGFEEIGKAEADKLESIIKKDAEDKVEKLFSKDTIYFNADFLKAVINGEGGEGRLQSRLTVFTHALAHSPVNSEKLYKISDQLRQWADSNILDGEISYAKLERKKDGTGTFYLGITDPDGITTEIKTPYDNKDYFNDLYRVLKIVAKDYQFRHPNENIENYQR